MMAAKIKRRAFISYARVNKEFATKLARGLRAEEFPIWFDQFDIPTGSRWDDQVEEALRECPIFMVILTPASIASQNVKDEIGYAIDHGKRILPVLLEDCDVPLRLRRFQYADFRAKDFEGGFESAKELLRDLVGAVSVAVTKSPAVQVPMEPKPVPDRLKREPVSPNIQKNPIFTGLAIGIAAAVILVVAGITFRIISQNRTSSLPIDHPSTETSVIETPTVQSPAPGSTMISNSDTMTLVYVPAGEFTMGSNGGDTDEKPVHQVLLDAFWIDKTEVTNGMYEACVLAGTCVSPANPSSQNQIDYYGNSQFENYPVINVTWNDANAYCTWAGRRLPTEAEWEKAARGTDAPTYPWGDEPDETFANYGSYLGDTTAVGNYENGQSPYGVFDMAGNVAEWTADWFVVYPGGDPSASNEFGQKYRVIRGGSWKDTDFSIRSAKRSWEDPANSANTIGFRCALSNP